MVKAKKPLTTGIPRIQLTPRIVVTKPNEPSLLLLRLHELDREFIRQTKQLRKITRDIRRKIIKKI